MPTYGTVAEAIRASIIGTGLVGERVFLEYAPVDTATPHCTMNPQVDMSPSLKGDSGSSRWSTSWQVDLWQLPEDEDMDLVVDITYALNSFRFTLLNVGNARINVQSASRIPEPQGDRLIHHAISGEVIHPL